MANAFAFDPVIFPFSFSMSPKNPFRSTELIVRLLRVDRDMLWQERYSHLNDEIRVYQTLSPDNAFPSRMSIHGPNGREGGRISTYTSTLRRRRGVYVVVKRSVSLGQLESGIAPYGIEQLLLEDGRVSVFWQL